MKLVDISCPHCGGAMTITDNVRTVHCKYCEHDFLIDDETMQVNHRISNAEQAGYLFEGGRWRFKREKQEWEARMEEVNCPLCGFFFYADSDKRFGYCPDCKKEVNIPQAMLFCKGLYYEKRGDFESAVHWYDKALQLDPDTKLILAARNRVKKDIPWNRAIAGIGILALVAVFIKFTPAAVSAIFISILLISALLLCVFDNNEKASDEATKSESANSPTSSHSSDDMELESEGIDLESEFATPSIIPTPEVCQSKLLEIDWLLTRYEGDDTMTAYLRDKQADWEQLLFEAQTEEDDM